jgi:hypothetical protein
MRGRAQLALAPGGQRLFEQRRQRPRQGFRPSVGSPFHCGQCSAILSATGSLQRLLRIHAQRVREG